MGAPQQPNKERNKYRKRHQPNTEGADDEMEHAPTHVSSAEKGEVLITWRSAKSRTIQQALIQVALTHRPEGLACGDYQCHVLVGVAIIPPVLGSGRLSGPGAPPHGRQDCGWLQAWPTALSSFAPWSEPTAGTMHSSASRALPTSPCPPSADDRHWDVWLRSCWDRDHTNPLHLWTLCRGVHLHATVRALVFWGLC